MAFRRAEIGGVDYIVQLAESVPSHLHATHYARLVRDKAMLRDLIAASARITEEAYGHEQEARDILDRAEQLLFQVTDQRIAEQATPIRAADTEAALEGAAPSAETADRAAETLRAEIQPIDDVRSTADYRREVAARVLHRLIRDEGGW